MHHQGRLIGHEKRDDYARLRHIQDKPPSHHTGHSELTKTLDGMDPHSGDTVSVPSNRRMVLKIHGLDASLCTGRPLPSKDQKKPDFFQRRRRLYTCHLNTSQFSFRLAILFSHFTSTDCI